MKRQTDLGEAPLPAYRAAGCRSTALGTSSSSPVRRWRGSPREGPVPVPIVRVLIVNLQKQEFAVLAQDGPFLIVRVEQGLRLE
jgi:hypothetical protein